MIRNLWRWLVLAFVLSYWLVPMLAALEFSLRARRGIYSFDAYVNVLADPRFQTSFFYSAGQSLAAVLLTLLITLPAAYAVRLKLPQFRPVLEFVSLLPMIVPAIIIVFGYLRLYNSSSVLPLTDSRLGTDFLLACGYAALALPYVYRALDTGLASVDVRTLTEAAESLGAKPATILLQVILPNIQAAILSSVFLTIAIVLGEFTFSSLLDRPALAPFIQLIGTARAYEPVALSLMAFALTWTFMAFVAALGRKATR